jgi:Putative sensor
LNDSALTRFFGVVARPQTWLGILFHVLAFPFGLFYFVFLVTGISVGVGLVVVWVGIPILLVVAGAWWLFGAFERIQAHYLLGADVGQAPREWEKADGVWGKLRAHFGSSATWKDLLYLFAKLVFGTISFTLLVLAGSMVGWLLAIPFFAVLDVPIVNGTWVPPLWFGVLAVPLGILAFFASLHALNGWGWVCARWAEVMFRGPWTASAGARLVTPATGVAAGPPPQPPAVQGPSQPPAVQGPPQPPQTPASQALEIPSPPQPGDDVSSSQETSRP